MLQAGLFVKIIKPTTGIMVNVGIFVNTASPKSIPDIKKPAANQKSKKKKIKLLKK